MFYVVAIRSLYRLSSDLLLMVMKFVLDVSRVLFKGVTLVFFFLMTLQFINIYLVTVLGSYSGLGVPFSKSSSACYRFDGSAFSRTLGDLTIGNSLRVDPSR